ncbi:MAG TPA: J domain-containing protein [Planctomycetota bacterium]
MDVSFDEIADACRTLFGEQTVASPEFVAYLRPPGLRAAFRSLAKENHPDRAAVRGVSAQVLGERFKKIRAAYELLRPFVEDGQAVPQPVNPLLRNIPNEPAAEHSKRAPDNPWARQDRYYEGALPDRALRFGEFLFYARRITWRDLISAIVWQSHHRPRLGEIALEKGWLSADQICLIRRHARVGELWGQTALRAGLLNQPQLLLLLGSQRMCGKAIGRYFVDAGIFSEASLSELLAEHRRHSQRYTRAKDCRSA